MSAYDAVLERRRLIFAARQAGAPMPWDKDRPAPLTPIEKEEAGIPLTSEEAFVLSEQRRMAREAEEAIAAAEAKKKEEMTHDPR